MKKLIIIPILLLISQNSKADLWGGDLPLLAQIVANTLQTLHQLETQTTLLKDEMRGIKDKIYRIQTIADTIQPSHWNQWKDPEEALRRLRTIYYTLPPEYRNPKSDLIEEELSRSMNLIARLSKEASNSFKSGKELEKRGADSSPGVAQKLTASGIGTLISLESQNQITQSHIVSLLSQILADGNEKESRMIVSRGRTFSGFSENLGSHDGLFSTHVLPLRIQR